MDKLRLYTPHSALPRAILNTYFEGRPPKQLDCGLMIYHHIDRETGVHLTGAPNGLLLELNPTKFLRGDNYEMIDRKGLLESIEALNERYQPATKFESWDVSSFDFNSNIEVEYQPAVYLLSMGNLKQWHHDSFYRTGKTYSTASNTKAFTIYDLNLRCKKDGKPIPPESAGKHIIRLEASFNKMLPKIKELRTMRTMQDYTQPENYAKLPEMWLKTYELIEKNEPVEHIPNLTRRESDMLAAIQHHTLNGYREKLKIDYPDGRWRYHFKEVDKLLEKVRAHRARRSMLTQVEELSQKVRQRAAELILAV